MFILLEQFNKALMENWPRKSVLVLIFPYSLYVIMWLYLMGHLACGQHFCLLMKIPISWQLHLIIIIKQYLLKRWKKLEKPILKILYSWMIHEIKYLIHISNNCLFIGCLLRVWPARPMTFGLTPGLVQILGRVLWRVCCLRF